MPIAWKQRICDEAFAPSRKNSFVFTKYTMYNVECYSLFRLIFTRVCCAPNLTIQSSVGSPVLSLLILVRSTFTTRGA